MKNGEEIISTVNCIKMRFCIVLFYLLNCRESLQLKWLLWWLKLYYDAHKLLWDAFFWAGCLFIRSLVQFTDSLIVVKFYFRIEMMWNNLSITKVSCNLQRTTTSNSKCPGLEKFRKIQMSEEDKTWKWNGEKLCMQQWNTYMEWPLLSH